MVGKLSLVLLALLAMQVAAVDKNAKAATSKKWSTSWSNSWQSSWSWSYSYSYSWSWSNNWPIPEEPKCKKGLCVPVQPWLKNRDTGAVNGRTLEEVCNEIRDCNTCAESPNCDWDPTYSEGCDKAQGPKARKCKDWEGGEPYPGTDEFIETQTHRAGGALKVKKA